ncbi:MAG: 4'-phosphopantetheinyl transferase family protein [Gammaproteobacteria bacterium]
MTQAWKNPPSDLELSRGFVDIWRTKLDLPKQEIAAYLSLLSPDEVKRASCFKVKRKYREYVITRGLLRRVLGDTLRADPKGFLFEYAEHEKPFLKEDWGGGAVSFNVSHSHNQAVIAVTLDRTIGIDIEKIRQNVDFNKLANRFFSVKEFKSLKRFQEQHLPRAFFACWTRKEAFVKALGDGISFGLSEFSVSVDPDEENVTLSTHWDPGEARKWTLVNIKTDTDYIAACAFEGGKFEIRYWE